MKDDDDFKFFPTHWKVIFVVLVIYLYVVGVC